MAAVVGIDLSTQSCTVEARDIEDFRVLARSRAPLPATTPPVSEHDTEDWWTALRVAVSELGESLDLQQVQAIAVTGQCHGLVALNRDGIAIRPVKLWNDTTSAPQMAELIRQIGKNNWIERIGSLPTAAFTVSKLAWLIENEPENVARIAKILLPHDYLTFRLTGQEVTDRSEASGTGYFNSERNVYDYAHLRECFGEVLPWEEMFPRVAEPSEVAGYLLEDVAVELGFKAGVPVGIGGGDQHMAALGLGIGPGDIVFSLGTSGVVFASTDQPVTDLSGQVDGVANVVGGWLPLVCTLNATKVTDWAARLLGVSVQELGSLALEADPRQPAVPVFASYLDGERTPAYPEATAVLSQVVGATDRSDFAAAMFLGVIMGLVRGVDAITQAGVDTGGRVIAVGGGAKSPAYRQLIADLMGRPVEVLSEPEATVRGACIQALAVLRGEQVAAVGQKVRPESAGITYPRFEEALWPEMRETYLRTADFAATTRRIERPQ